MYYSFIMLKPDAVERGLTMPIMARLKDAGIEIEVLDCRKPSTELLCQHYADVIAERGNDFVLKYADYFTNRWVLPMIVKSEQSDIIPRIRKLAGATDPAKAEKGTIRGDFGIDSYEKCKIDGHCCQNLIHASDSPESFRREVTIWFGESYAEKYAK
ncbi:MAG: hypothetical protein LKE53_01185 [Oscillospiraceae bacterium]|jgi:nucleoside-diphosphate kinase|nr:hypothetical protein [Oscillospiraceae bacterium]MDD3260630.1 nucleoside-diphosphate kinase [Oscillospiraceae bacterium]